MTLLFLDGFDHGDFTQIWTSTTGAAVGTTTFRTGTRSLTLGSNTAAVYRALSASEEDDGVTMGAAFFSNNDNNDGWASGLELGNLTSGVHLSVWRNNTNKRLELWRGARTYGTTALLASTEVNIWFPNVWNYIELQGKIADTGGRGIVRLDGVTVIDFTGDTQNAGDGIINAGGLRSGTGTQVNLVDDVYILNEQGAAPRNTFIGDLRLYPLYPNGNGNYSQLVGSDGNSTDNYLLVDEVGTPSMTDYVGSATDGNKDTYTFENMTQTLGTILGVESRLFALKSDTGTKQIRAVHRISATDSTGADHVLSVAESSYRDVWAQNPQSAADWTITNINDSEWGAEVRP